VFDPLDDCEDIDIAIGAQIARPTLLAAWFTLNLVDIFASTLTYVEIPNWYVWQPADKVWKRRTRKSQVLGRLYPVDPTSQEACALRLLLLHARGCTSFDSIRTVFGELRPTFVEAAQASGLLDDDDEYLKCMSSELIRGSDLRSLLLIIIIHCCPSNPMNLILAEFDRLTEDFLGTPQQKNIQLFQFVATHSDVPFSTLCLDPPCNMPASRPFLESFVSSPNVQSGVLNEEQQICHDAIWHSVEAASGSLFALLAPAGTGKTFLINAILSTARQHGRRVVASATSGLAASLIGYSRTAHCTFKIPVNVDEDSFCKSTARYKQWLQSIDCFIWDEISMAHRWAIDAVDRSLQDIRQNR
jgi:hypothetical protein